MGAWFDKEGGRLGGVALLGALILVLVAAIAVTVGLERTRALREQVLRGDENVQSLHLLQRDIRLAETGQRGFLLTDNPAYLGPYDEGRRRVPSDLAALRAGRLAGAGDLAGLEALIVRKLDELALTVRLHATSPASALDLVRSDVGQRYMDAIDRGVDRLVEAERGRLRADTVGLNGIVDETAAAAGGTVALAALAGAIGLFLLKRQQRLVALEALNATLEGRVEERTRSLLLANQELDAFAYTISHDLRAPLRAIHGYADVVREEADVGCLDPELLGYLGRIAGAADQMNRLIDDMLAYARLSKEALTVRPLSLDAVLDEALAEIRGECADAAIDIVRPLGEALGHPAALRQAFENLLSNACKYHRPGRAATIRIRGETHGGRRRIWVVDDGIGVAPEHRARVFLPFERLHGIESYPGTGIGLAIVQRSVERMGGRCGLEAAPDGGSAFWIELPTAEEAR